jgi:hypothetical protein
LLPFDGARQSRDLVVDFHEVALVRQPVLLQLQFERPHEVELFRDGGFAAEYFELQIGVRKPDDRVARLDHGAVFDQDLFDAPALDRVEVHGAARYQPPAHRDEVLERADRHLGDGDAFGIDAEAASGEQRAGEPAREQQYEQRNDSVHQLAAHWCLFLDAPVHALPGNRAAAVLLRLPDV